MPGVYRYRIQTQTGHVETELCHRHVWEIREEGTPCLRVSDDISYSTVCYECFMEDERRYYNGLDRAVAGLFDTGTI